MAPVVVFPRGLNSRVALSVLVLRQDAVCEGRTALQGQAKLASVAKAVDNIVAVDRALDGTCQYLSPREMITQGLSWNSRSSWHSMKTF